MDPFLTSLEATVSTLPHGEEYSFDAAGLTDVEGHGYKPSLGLGVPGTKHYRRTIGPDNAMHLKLLAGEGTLHREHVNPHDNLVGHLVKDMKLRHWAAVLVAAGGVAGAFWLLARRR